MAEDLEALRAAFVKAFSAVPAKLRGKIVALVGRKPFNWNTAYIEIVGKTSAGDEILRHLALIGVLESGEE